VSDTSPYFGTTGTLEDPKSADQTKLKKSHKRTAYPTPALGWVNPPANEAQHFARLRVLARAVILSPTEEIAVLSCVSDTSARANAAHFGRIANGSVKRGKVTAKAIGNRVIAVYDPKAKRA
jgi:hypothetical protein